MQQHRGPSEGPGRCSLVLLSVQKPASTSQVCWPKSACECVPHAAGGMGPQPSGRTARLTHMPTHTRCRQCCRSVCRHTGVHVCASKGRSSHLQVLWQEGVAGVAVHAVRKLGGHRLPLDRVGVLDVKAFTIRDVPRLLRVNCGCADIQLNDLQAPRSPITSP